MIHSVKRLFRSRKTAILIVHICIPIISGMQHSIILNLYQILDPLGPMVFQEFLKKFVRIEMLVVSNFYTLVRIAFLTTYLRLRHKRLLNIAKQFET